MKNMTLRKLKKVNSSDPSSRLSSHDDIYFPSSKSDSCKTMDLPTNSEVYNYKTLAYSGGTLPRNFRKVCILFNLITLTFTSSFNQVV